MVAGEVRKLAENSDRSAKEIKGLLDQFEASIERVTSGIRKNSTISQNQARVTQEISMNVENLQRIGLELSEISFKL